MECARATSDNIFCCLWLAHYAVVCSIYVGMWGICLVAIAVLFDFVR